MRRILLLSAAVALLLAAAPSFAQQHCQPGTGKHFSGKCMDPKLSTLEDSMQQTEIVASQPNFSYSAPLVPPDKDQLAKQQKPGETYEQKHEFSGHAP